MDMQASKSRKVSKIIYLGLTFVFLLVALFMFFIPSILSSEWGKAKLLNLVNHRISGNLEIDALSFTWSGPQQIKGVRLKDAEGNRILTVETASAKGSIFYLIRKWAPTDFLIEQLNLDLTSDLSGFTNLQHALQKECCMLTYPSEKLLAPIALKNVYAHVNLTSSKAPFLLQIEGESEQGTSKGAFKIEAISNGLTMQQLIEHQSNLKELFRGSSEKGVQINADITNFPTPLLDQLVTYKFPQLSGALLQLIGDQLNISLKQSGNIDQSSFLFDAHSSQLALSATIGLTNDLLKVNIQSNKMTTSEITLKLENTLRLQQPFKAIFTLPSQLLNEFLPHQAKLINQPETTLIVHEFACPSPSQNKFSLEEIFAKADLLINPCKMTYLPSASTFNFDQLKIALSASPHTDTNCSLHARLSEQEGQGFITQTIGTEADLNVQALISMQNNATPQLEHLNLNLSSELLTVTSQGQMMEDGVFFVTAPTFITYKISDSALQALGIKTEKYLFVQQNPIKLTIDPMQFDIKKGSFPEMHLSGEMVIPDLLVQSKSNRIAPKMGLQDLSGRWIYDGVLGKLKLDVGGMTRLGENQAEGKISGTLTLDHLLNEGHLSFEQASLKGDLKTEKLPVELISSLSGYNNLTSLIGSALNAHLSLDLALQPVLKGNIQLNTISERLQGQAKFVLDRSLTLAESQPAEFRLHLTPNGFSVLSNILFKDRPQNFILDGSSVVNLKISALNLPFSSSKNQLDLFSSSINADLTIDQLTSFDTKQAHKIKLENVRGQFNSRNISQEILYHLSGQGNSSLHGVNAWSIEGALQHGFLSDGSLNQQNLTLSLEGMIQALPVALLSQIGLAFPHAQKMEAIFGPTLNAKISTRLKQMQGPLSIQLNGQNAQFALEAMIDRGVATLNQDVTLEVKVTPELGRTVLQAILPITEGMLSADQPLKLTIPYQGVSLPFYPLSLQEIVIPKVSIELGKVTFSSASQLAKVLSLLFTPHDQFQVWITPAYFSFKNGSIHLKRIDLLINDSYPLATWGDVELIKEKVNMIIGITGASLNKAFNLSGISNHFMLQLPLKGPLSGPSIDKAKATTRIGSLVAQSRGGTHGAILGTVLDIASGSLSEDPVPEPSTKPLPWADLLRSDAKDNREEDQVDSEKAHSKYTIDGIGKGANTLLKKILNR